MICQVNPTRGEKVGSGCPHPISRLVWHTLTHALTTVNVAHQPPSLQQFPGRLPKLFSFFNIRSAFSGPRRPLHQMGRARSLSKLALRSLLL